MTRHEKRAIRAVNILHQALDDVRQDYPKAEWYLSAHGSLNMMAGPSHDEHARPRQDRILFTIDFEADGGDW